MKNWLGFLMVGALVAVAPAQDWAPNSAPAPAAPVASAPNPNAPTTGALESPEGEWVPEGVAVLGRRASSRMEFRLDHTILALASKIDSGNPEFRRAIAGLNGVSFRSFHFAEGNPPDGAVMETIGREYQDAGWLHAMSKHANSAGGSTDLWIRVQELAIREVAVMLVRGHQVDIVSASGMLSPLELLHLSGHFGIPKMDQPVEAPPAPSANAEDVPDRR
jgi:hypothetical protein